MKDDETRITDLLLIEERPKAIKVRYIRKGEETREVWLPRSEITISKDPIIPGELHRTISVTMKDWLALEKKLE